MSGAINLWMSLSVLQLARHTTPMYRTPEMLDLYSNFPINENMDIWVRDDLQRNLDNALLLVIDYGLLIVDRFLITGCRLLMTLILFITKLIF